MLLLTAVLALAVPSVRGFFAASRSRDAATQLVALTEYARARAAADGQVYRLTIDGAAGSYWLAAQEGTEFVHTGTDFGRTFTLPANLRIDVQRATSAATADGGGGTHIDFYPDGRCDQAAVRLTDLSAAGAGRTAVIACLSSAEPYRVLSPEEAARL